MVLAAANAALDVLSAGGGAALAQANQQGARLMEGIRSIAAQQGVPLQVTGFGAAFGVHFTKAAELNQYRDTFADDKERLTRYVRAMLDQGIYLLPDGRAYTSCVHTGREVDETLAAFARVVS